MLIQKLVLRKNVARRNRVSIGKGWASESEPSLLHTVAIDLLKEKLSFIFINSNKKGRLRVGKGI